MIGLVKTSAAFASLLLNLEAVLTAVLAWVFFKESTDRRIMLGMFLIVAGGITLSWSKQPGTQSWPGSFAIASACLCWAIDNNLTRKFRLPMRYLLLVGFLGYGVSLVLFVLALRGLGTARTGAYFSTAPFIGAAIAILFFHESTSLPFWLAAVLMGIGVWIHLTEDHDHVHTHEELYHEHSHVHDDHHQHEHDFEWDGKEPHSHPHKHEPLTHSHRHYPDIHHRHRHK